MTTIKLAQEQQADDLLSRDLFALLTGMLLDQQFPMERAFSGPYRLLERMVGELTEASRRLESVIAETNADELIVAAAIHDHSARVRSYEILATVQQSLGARPPG